MADGVLNPCDLTFKDLQTIREVFIQVLQGVHHPRVTYPEPVQPAAEVRPRVNPLPLAAIETTVITNGGNGHIWLEPTNGVHRERSKETLGGIEEMEVIS